MCNFARSSEAQRLVSIALSLSFCIATAASATERKSGNITHLTGTVTKSELNDALERVGITLSLSEGPPQILRAYKVRPGSVAYYGGVSSGDRIVDLVHKENGCDLLIERNGHTYKVSLEKLDARAAVNTSTNNLLLSMATKTELRARINENLAKAQSNQKLLKSGTNKDEDLKKLKDYQVELILDRTGSMSEKDGTGDLTKFQWCEQNTVKLAQELGNHIPTLAVTVFNTTFQTYPNCDPAKIHDLYVTLTPEGCTDVIDPLKDRIDHFLRSHDANHKKLLVAVIHDGMPNEPGGPEQAPPALKRAIIDLTKSLDSPDQVTITFLQIGDSFEGGRFLTELDDNLVSEGAKYDIVDTKTFAEVKAKGLRQCLLDAISEQQPGTQNDIQKNALRQMQKKISRLAPLSTSSGDGEQTDSSLQQTKQELEAIQKAVAGQ